MFGRKSKEPRTIHHMENLNFLEDTFFERDVTFFRFDIFF